MGQQFGRKRDETRKGLARGAACCVVKTMNSHSQHHHHDHTPDAARDPVCGMTPAPDTAHRSVHAGEEVLFCSAGCKEKFDRDPAKYVTPAHTNAATADDRVKWTCPMHPQIIRDGPGSCPICGMALEPMMPSADAGPILN